MSTAVMAAEGQLTEIDARLERLERLIQAQGEQIQYLAEQAKAAHRRQQEWAELWADMTPIVQDLYAVTVSELEEIQQHVQLQELLGLLKRLLRSTDTLNALLEQLESLQDLLADGAPLTRDLFEQAVVGLDGLERRGYFGFARQGLKVIDQIVASFGEEDVRLLGENIVLILNTVKLMTQPEIMQLAQKLTIAYQQVEGKVDELPTSVWGLLGQMRQPEVRRGLAVTMAMLKAVAHQQPAPGQAVEAPSGAPAGQSR